jgi:hypothetical protein
MFHVKQSSIRKHRLHNSCTALVDYRMEDAPTMFHVKHQNSGLFRGVPTDLGYSNGVRATFVSI